MGLFNTFRFIWTHPFNRGRRAEAFLRFARWQVGSRLVPGPVIVEWVGGASLIVSPGDAGMTGNLYCGLHEFEDMGFVLHALTRDDLFVDVGANSGSYTVLACGAAGARSIAVEPVPSTRARLLRNVALNGLGDRVKVIACGVGDREETLRFSTDEDCTNHVVSSGEGRGNVVSVPVRRLDELLAGESPSFLKIDVEGFEWNVLEGARDTLRRETLFGVLIELIGSGARYGHRDEDVHALLRKEGFETYQYDPFTRRLRPLEGRPSPTVNTLYLRGSLPVIEKRLLAAPRFRLFGREV